MTKSQPREAEENARLDRILAIAKSTDLTVDFLEALTRDLPAQAQEKVLANASSYPRHKHVVLPERVPGAQAA